MKYHDINLEYIILILVMVEVLQLLNFIRIKLYDLGTKGSGLTPYSRGGDGRLTLKGGVREVLCSSTSMLSVLVPQSLH